MNLEKKLCFLIVVFFIECSTVNKSVKNTLTPSGISGKWIISGAYSSYSGGRVNFYEDGNGYCYPERDSSQRCYFKYSFSEKLN